MPRMPCRTAGRRGQGQLLLKGVLKGVEIVPVVFDLQAEEPEDLGKALLPPPRELIYTPLPAFFSSSSSVREPGAR